MVTITAVSPTIGHTGGKTLVLIEGSGFRLPTIPDPDDNGITPEGPPSVVVTFGGVRATTVRVASTGLLYVTTAPADETAEPVDVVVTNIDDDGAPISGETATQASAWRYVRPNVTGPRSDLVRMIDTLLRDLKRQVVANVAWPAHTDFDPDTEDTLSVVDVPSFPGLILAATQLEDSDFAVRGEQEIDDPDDDEAFLLVKEPVTVNVLFMLVGVSDNSKELLNLSAATRLFFKMNPRLTMARDPSNSARGTVSFDMSARDAKGVRLQIEASKDNVQTFALVVRVENFPLESMPLTDAAGNEPELSDAIVELGKTVADDGVVLSIEPRR